MSEITHYRATNGQHRLIAQMHTAHLASAIAKLERDEPSRTDELTAMRAEHAARPDKDPAR